MSWFTKPGLTGWLRYLGVAAILVVGGVHLQQYYGYEIRFIPTVGTLFLLNAVGAAVIAVMLLVPSKLVRMLGAVGGIGLSAGAIVAILLSMTPHGIFGYIEAVWRPVMVVAVVAEAVSVLLLGAYVLIELSKRTRERRSHRIAVVRPSRAAG